MSAIDHLSVHHWNWRTRQACDLDYFYTVIFNICRGLVWPLQTPKQLNAQVPYIKWCGRCVSVLLHIHWLCIHRFNQFHLLLFGIWECGTCWNEGANFMYTHMYFLMGEETFYQKRCCIRNTQTLGVWSKSESFLIPFLLLICLVSIFSPARRTQEGGGIFLLTNLESDPRISF